MAKRTSKGGSIIGAVGAILIGSALLLFVCTIILNNLKDNAGTGTTVAGRADWNTTNSTIDTLKNFLTISAVLLGVLGITMIGAQIIAYIGGAFGGM